MNRDVEKSKDKIKRLIKKIIRTSNELFVENNKLQQLLKIDVEKGG